MGRENAAMNAEFAQNFEAKKSGPPPIPQTPDHFADRRYEADSLRAEKATNDLLAKLEAKRQRTDPKLDALVDLVSAEIDEKRKAKQDKEMAAQSAEATAELLRQVQANRERIVPLAPGTEEAVNFVDKQIAEAQALDDKRVGRNEASIIVDQAAIDASLEAEARDIQKQAEIAKARELFQTMEARKAELQKREAIAKLEREEQEQIAEARKIIEAQKDELSSLSFDELLKMAEPEPKAKLRGTPVSELGRSREMPIKPRTVELRSPSVGKEIPRTLLPEERAESAENAMRGMEDRIKSEVSRLQADLDLPNNQQYTEQLRALLTDLDTFKANNEMQNAIQLGEKIILTIQKMAEENKKRTEAARIAERQAREKSITLSNPKAKPTGIISKIGKFFGFGK